MSVGFLTDPGLVRERNEDSYAVHLPYAGEASRAPADAFFAVADGMGGHEAGDYASQYVAGAAQKSFAERGEPIVDVSAWLERMIRRVNRELTSIAKREFNARGMGSTLTIAVLQSGRLHLGHIGDSRAYRLYGGELEQLTPDHSWVGEQVRSGLLTSEQAAVHPKRNLLTQCLGIDADVTPYLAEEPLRDGSRYLLCSDGLFGAVPDAVLRHVLLDEREPQSAATRLVAIANEAGGSDNITAVVFDILEASELIATLPGVDEADAALLETAGGVTNFAGATATAGVQTEPRPEPSPAFDTSPDLQVVPDPPSTPAREPVATASSSLPRLLTILGFLLLAIGAGVAALELFSRGDDAPNRAPDAIAVPAIPESGDGDAPEAGEPPQPPASPDITPENPPG